MLWIRTRHSTPNKWYTVKNSFFSPSSGEFCCVFNRTPTWSGSYGYIETTNYTPITLVIKLPTHKSKAVLKLKTRWAFEVYLVFFFYQWPFKDSSTCSEEMPKQEPNYLFEVVRAKSVQPRPSPCHLRIRPSATPVYGPSPLLSKTRLSGPTAPVTWIIWAVWSRSSEPGIEGGAKNSLELNANTTEQIASTVAMTFEFMVSPHTAQG